MLQINIEKTLHTVMGEQVLDINITLKAKEFVVLVGESGSGKSTLLRAIAGLDESKGEIVFDNIVWQNEKKKSLPQDRKIGFVFQDYALFENMSVKENLLFVNDDSVLANELLGMTKMETLSQRNVQFLSGGQKQRVALCRAMMLRPKLLLMDEPLSALDPKMRSVLREEIKMLHQRFGTITLMVTHDSEDIRILADRVLLLENGKISEENSI